MVVPEGGRWPATELSRLLLSDETLESVLRRAALLAPEVVPACDEAGVGVGRDGQIVHRSATEPIGERVDVHQLEVGEGPCLTALVSGRPHAVASMVDERRWPRFTPLAAEAGVVSSYSVPLTAGGETIGALNLYSLRATFGPADEEIAESFAAEVAVALANMEAYAKAGALVEQLSQAVLSRDLIGQAKGVIMARERCNPDEAFDVLRRASQRLNRKVRDVAGDIVASAADSPPPRD